MKIHYKIKLFNDVVEPYWTSKDIENSPLAKHVSLDEYETYDEKTFYDILNGFIDAPNKKLTDKTIRDDFDTNREPKLSQDRVDAIKTYYNGRFDLKKKIYADLNRIDIKKIKVGFPILFKYQIPFEMNFFSCDDNDPCEKMTTLNDSYIEIEISKHEDKD